MQRRDGRLVLSPTDLTKHVACPHITTLDLAALDAPRAEVAADDALNLVFAKGLAHEAAYLERLRAQGKSIEDIAELGLSGAEAEQATLEAMRRGVEVIYQATFFDGHWVGLADFLLRVEEPSELGPWRYDIADTKLARRLKVPALLQMATYAARLETLQGVPPRTLTVVTGDSAEHPWRLVDVAPYARRRRADLLAAIENPVGTESAKVTHCGQCRWKDRCAQEWLDRDDLIQVAGMRADHRAALRDAGIDTLEALATASGEAVAQALPRTRPVTRERLHLQAELQREERDSGIAQFRLVEPPWLVTRDQEGNERHVPRGLATMPEPDRGDVYLDFEGDPWAEDGAGREYLAGIWTREGQFVEFWAHDFEAEGRLTTDLLDWLTARWQQFPDMHIYHYAPYETTALKRLVGQHATREHELDQLLRAERFVDLYAVVRQGIRISKGSYSIKKLEEFYWGQTRSADPAAGVSDGLSSVVEYERWLTERDDHAAAMTRGDRVEDLPVDPATGLHPTLADIRRYNIEDVESTLALHEWLEARRSELIDRGFPLTRPTALEPKEISPEEQAEIDLAERLLESEPPATVVDEHSIAAWTRSAELLAGAVGWHRREDRPDWWEFFSYTDLETDDLVAAPGALGGLGAPAEVDRIKSSTIWRYEFPHQESAIRVGDTLHDVDSQARAGVVTGLDAADGWVEVKLGNRSAPVAARGFMRSGPLDNKGVRASIARTAEAFLAGESPLGVRLLERRVPAASVLAPRAGETPADVVRRVGRGLEDTVLAVQGPPGAGKTYAGAEVIRALVADGRRVGVTAQSHEVVLNLLRETGLPAVHKGGASTTTTAPGDDALVRVVDSNDDILAALAEGASLIGGTAWLWSREDLQDAVDVLIIDEAGQFSLANAVAVAPAANSLVLLGDPQQLMQPTKAAHPYGSGISVLDHLRLEDGYLHDVIPADLGVFLDSTYRLHPSITAFVSELAYEGQLSSAPGRETIDLRAPGPVSGTGLFWCPVEHQTLAEQSSPDEVARVTALVVDLLTGEWNDVEGVNAPITPSDIVVVGPFNVHVDALRAALPEGVRVGTVDKFQGQQGAVVIYSMGSTSAELAPRGVGFLYDVHRLNVAISRAKAAAVIVASPQLLDAPVHSPGDLRAVNALCRFVDTAKAI